MDSIEQREREQFEAAMRTAKNFDPFVLERDANGDYAVAIAESAWQGWRMRAALSAPQAGVPEDWQVVPKTLTGDMLEAGHEAGLISFTELREIWAELLAAAPPAPVQAVGQWLDIETAPKDGTSVLLGAAGNQTVSAEWREDVWFRGWLCGGHRSDCYGPNFVPTHWMPLPSALGAPAQEPAAKTTEPAAVALRFPGDSRLCLSTVFDTMVEAQEYADNNCRQGVELVPLYLGAPAQVPAPGDSKAAPVLLSESDIVEHAGRAVAEKIIAGIPITPEDWITFARAIESAVLRANGLGGG